MFLTACIGVVHLLGHAAKGNRADDRQIKSDEKTPAVCPSTVQRQPPASSSHITGVQLQSAIHWHIWPTAPQHTHTRTHNALLLYVKGKQREALKGTESPPVQLLSAKAVKTPDSSEIPVKGIMDGQFCTVTSAPDTSECLSATSRSSFDKYKVHLTFSFKHKAA